MKKLIIYISVFLIVITFISCGTAKKVSVISYSTPIESSQPIEVYGSGQKLPEGIKLLGTIQIDDSGFSTKCSYAEVIADAQNQARAMGGNIIYISKHKVPDFWSTCHRITAEVYLKNK